MLPLYIMPGSIAIIYFLILRPQQQQEQKRQAMIDAIKKNDKVADDGRDLRHGDSVDAGARPGRVAHRRRAGRQGRVHPVERGAGDRGQPRRSRPRPDRYASDRGA